MKLQEYKKKILQRSAEFIKIYTFVNENNTTNISKIVRNQHTQ